MRILIIGNQGGTNIGDSFFRAAVQERLSIDFLDQSEAFSGPRIIKAAVWRLLDKRPLCLGRFNAKVVDVCEKLRPDCCLVTGIAVVTSDTLRRMGSLGIKRINYLTDDPWNPSHRSRWFINALPFYDHIFTVRKSNLSDLLAIGVSKVDYLPFGYDPSLQYPVCLNDIEKERYPFDVLFVGGGDKDRISYISALLGEKFRLGLYGSYWERYKETRAYTLGQADPATLRIATAAARVSLCLLRRSNRDGNVMRSFEIPAIGGCMLTEDSEEHREIFGEEGKAVLYFKKPSEMVQKCQYLLAHDSERKRMACAAHDLITKAKHTYKDRLFSILSTAGF